MSDFDTDIANYNAQGPQVPLPPTAPGGGYTPVNPGYSNPADTALYNQMVPNQTSSDADGYYNPTQGASSLAFDKQQAANAKTAAASKAPMSGSDRFKLMTGVEGSISNAMRPTSSMNAYDAIFGHSGNPTPSTSLPSFNLPQLSPQQSTPGISVGGLAPVSMAGGLQPQNFNLQPTTSDRRAKKNVIGINEELNAFLTAFYRKV